MKHTDIAIIGGGASGLTAAVFAARRGAAVAVLEKNDRVGKKILATGNGRCNLGNVDSDLTHYFGSVDVQSVFSRFCGETDFFRSLGLWVTADEMGRLYPVSDKATAVLDALRLGLVRHNAEEICGFAVREITPTDEGFCITSDMGQSLTAKRVIVAAGGMTAPKFGSTGDGYQLAESLGHSIVPLYPALAPIAVAPKLVQAFAGIRIHAEVAAWRDGKFLGQTAGQVQFAKDALSGICVFDLAHLRPDCLNLNLLPWCENPLDILAEIKASRAHAGLDNLLTGLVPKRIGQAIFKACTARSSADMIGDLSTLELAAIANRLQNWEFETALAPPVWDKAQVTVGGICAAEVSMQLESTICPGVYFAGELLDVHAACGGFNLRWAWASGAVAGTAAVRSLGL